MNSAESRSSVLKEDPNATWHCYSSIGNAAYLGARAALSDALEQWRKAGGNEKQPWLGGEVYDTSLIHAPDNGSIADDPIKIGNSTEERVVFLDDIDVYDAKLILAVHGHQIDGAKRVAGNACINRAQAFFEGSRGSVQKAQNQLSTDGWRIVQQKRSLGLSPFGRSLLRPDTGCIRLFRGSVRRLRQKQVGNIFQSTGNPFFRPPVLLDSGGFCDFLSLQVQSIDTRRSSAKINCCL
jgi:hypothetical protein